jgi:excisionase family DNA binding protein
MEQLLTLDETKYSLRIGRTKLYQLLAEGEIISFHVGTRRLVRKVDLDAYVTRRLTEAGFELDDPVEPDA